MNSIERRIRRSLEKNLPEVRAVVSGSMPAFATSPRPSPLREIPVFTFHAVDPDRFDAQLRFLTENGYRTATADEWSDADPSPGEKRVVLSFDDADWTFWAYAYPLLRNWEARAVLFVVPGLVPDADACRPNLDDVIGGRLSREELARTGTADEVCSWPELLKMHESGHVDVQAHSMTHACIPVSSEIVEFVRPGLGYAGYKWVNVPISILDDEALPRLAPRWGAPIYRSRPRLSGATRFLETPILTDELVAAAAAADPRDLDGASWKARLRGITEGWSPDRRGTYETVAATEAAMRRELESAKFILERRLGKPITHHCHPWFVGSDAADSIAREVGYRAVHYGVDAPTRDPAPGLLRVRRVSEHFVRRLPGSDRISLWSIFRHRLTGPRT